MAAALKRLEQDVIIVLELVVPFLELVGLLTGLLSLLLVELTFLPQGLKVEQELVAPFSELVVPFSELVGLLTVAPEFLVAALEFLV